MASTKKTAAKSGKSTRVETKKPAVKKVATKASVTAAKKKTTAKATVKKTVKATMKVATKPTAKKAAKVTTRAKSGTKKNVVKASVKPVKKTVKKVVKEVVTKGKITAKKEPAKKAPVKKVVKVSAVKAKGTTKKTPAKKTVTKKVAVKKASQLSKTTVRKSGQTIKNKLSDSIKPKAGKIIKVKKEVEPKVVDKKTSTTKKSRVKLIKTIEEGKQMVETIDTRAPVKHHTEIVGKSHHMVAGIEGLEPYKPIENEIYMSEGQVKHFRVILESMRKQLMEDVDRTVNDMRDSDKNLSDFTDRATNEEEMFFMLRTRTREGKLLKKIEEALDRLEHHDYGFCDSCGVEIGIRRLEARPTATLCIDCKTLDEIREKQRGG